MAPISDRSERTRQLPWWHSHCNVAFQWIVRVATCTGSKGDARASESRLPPGTELRLLKAQFLQTPSQSGTDITDKSDEAHARLEPPSITSVAARVYRQGHGG